MIEIDGSYGEGGGQILRTALSLSCLFGAPFRIFDIRKRRSRPGLMPQHLTGVTAAQRMTGADVRGGSVGSTELFFSPRELKEGEFFFDVGTAGSTSLIAQALLPAPVLSRKAAVITLRGGTHVPFSPSFSYLAQVFVPFLGRLGIEVGLTAEAYGFYPKGGGLVRIVAQPAGALRPLRVAERGRITGLTGCSAVAGALPLSIAERQRDSLKQRLAAEPDAPSAIDIETAALPSPGQGTFVFLRAESQHSVAGFTALGARGKRAEAVGREAAEAFLAYHSSNAALDRHLADQIVLYLALCGERSVFTTEAVTDHLMTNLWAIGLFHDYRYAVEGERGRPGRVTIN